MYNWFTAPKNPKKPSLIPPHPNLKPKESNKYNKLQAHSYTMGADVEYTLQNYTQHCQFRSQSWNWQNIHEQQKQAVPYWITLKELGHPQPSTCITSKKFARNCPKSHLKWEKGSTPTKLIISQNIILLGITKRWDICTYKRWMLRVHWLDPACEAVCYFPGCYPTIILHWFLGHSIDDC